MIAAIYNRVSTENQEVEGTSLGTQLEACLKYCHDKSYDVLYRFSEAYSGLTLERPKLIELRELVRNEQIDLVVVYCLDRLSRDPTHGVILTQELEKHNVKLEAVTEDVDNTELGKLISYIRGFASKIEVEKIKERTMRGKIAKSKSGHIAGGYGCYHGYFGLRYEPDKNAFSYDSGKIEVAKEILQRYASGDSCLSIVKDLQSRGITGPSGKIIHQSTVSRILSHAQVYAGNLKWNGIEMKDKVEPIISQSLADIVDKRRQLNKQQSLGYGKRKWFSGRVFCGVCGHRYVIQKKQGCRCNGASDQAVVKCLSPRVPYRLLERLLTKALLFAYADKGAVIARVTESYQNWQTEMKGLEVRQQKLEHELGILTDRRRRLSVQHETGVLTDNELIERIKAIKSEENVILDAIAEIQKFRTDRTMADPEQIGKGFDWIKRLGEMRPYISLLGTSPERHKIGAELADALDFKATILPENGSFKVEVKVNLPLEPIEIKEQSYSAIVFTSSY